MCQNSSHYFTFIKLYIALKQCYCHKLAIMHKKCNFFFVHNEYKNQEFVHICVMSCYAPEFDLSNCKYFHFHHMNTYNICKISGIHHKVDESCTLLRYYTAQSGNSLPTFHDNLPVPNMGLKGSPKKSVGG